MRTRHLLLGAVIVLALEGALLTGFRWGRGSPLQPRVFIGHHDYAGDFDVADGDRVKDIRLSCPTVAFVSDSAQADYSLMTRWNKGLWSGRLWRSDSAYLLAEEDADYNRLVRNACAAIGKDASAWLVPLRSWQSERKREARQPVPDRYELRDIHNARVATSAVIDKQTGKVWVWTDAGFVQEDFVPEPESKPGGR